VFGPHVWTREDGETPGAGDVGALGETIRTLLAAR
jgi:hypothetical protein